MSTSENVEDMYRQLARTTAMSYDEIKDHFERIKNMPSFKEQDELREEIKNLEFESMKRNAFTEEKRRRIRLQTGQKKWRKPIPQKKKKRK